MLILLGSRALQYYGWNERTPKDTDLLGDYDEVINTYRLPDMYASYPINEGKKWIIKGKLNIIETELTWPGSLSKELYNLILQQNHIKQSGILIPGLDILYLLKMSHRYLKNSPHFLKTMRDIQWMRRSGCEITEELKDFFVRREKETYHYPHPSLMKPKNAFFTGDGVKYVYDHDSIHDAVAIGQYPAYKSYQKEGAEVLCDKVKWDALPYATKLSGVLEEAYVLALERSQIPYKGTVAPKASFDMALMKVCTSITSGWFREFAWENYDEVQKRYDPEYVNKFFNKVRLGEVKEYGS